MNSNSETEPCIVEKKGWRCRVRDVVLGDEVKSKEEARLVQKLDLLILIYCCLASFFNYLDRNTFANAYVAGLKEDLALQGNEYNVVLAMFTAGSVAAQIPHGLVLQKIPPRRWLPSMVLVWAVLTMCCAACTTYAQLCAVRFLQGIAEASTYCGTMYIVGSWYRPREIAKRTAIFTAAGQAGTMFAGIMMTAIYSTLESAAGLRGWQWLFLLNGLITIPVGVAGFFVVPDTPEAGSSRWLTAAEKEFALLRLPPKRADAHNIRPGSLARRVLRNPAIYVLCTWCVVTGALEAYVVQSVFLLWMKYHNDVFTQTQINTYPLGVQAVGIVSNILAAVHVDATGKRVPMGVLACVLQLVSCVLFLVPGISFAGTMAAFYISGTSYIVNPVTYGWANIILMRSGDDAARAVILYSMNAFSTCLYTFWGIVFYPATDAPYWRKGAIVMVIVVVVMLGLLFGVDWLDKYTLRKYPHGDRAARETSGVFTQMTLEGSESVSKADGREEHVVENKKDGRDL